jgi:ribonuclease HI
MKKVIIYTDGACSGNPGNGGWGAILIYGDKEKEISGFEEVTTNNRMELTAAIEALKRLRETCEVELYSDSAYLINGFNNNWVSNWKANGWRTSSKEEVKNIDLWKELEGFNKFHKIKWIKVKGHSDNEYNNRCDKLATGEIKKYKST